MPNDPLFPFQEIPSSRMHRSIVSTIRSPHFFFGLPNLSPASWNLIVDNTKERERLEFLGDALIGSTVSEQLCRYWPNECPKFYTLARSVLTANSTFAHLMCKVGHHDIKDPVKPAGDAFETILAAFHSEQGLTAFNDYINQYFLPLINCAANAYHDNRMAATKVRGKRHKQIQTQKLTSAMLGNIRAHRPSNGLRKHMGIRGFKKRILESSKADLARHNVAAKNLVPTKLFSLLGIEKEVIDLTSDNEESQFDDDNDSITEIDISSFKQCTAASRARSHKMASSSNAISIAMTSPCIRPRIGTSDAIKQLKSQHILRSISVSPRKGSATELDIPQTGPQNSATTNDHDLIVQFSKASLYDQLGSTHNPIVID